MRSGPPAPARRGPPNRPPSAIPEIVDDVDGALLLRIVLGGVATGLGTPLAHGLVLGGMTATITPAIGFVAEAVLAFFLVTVVLSTAVAGRTAYLTPVAIGLTLVLNIDMGGLTGAYAPTPSMRVALLASAVVWIGASATY